MGDGRPAFEAAVRAVGSLVLPGNEGQIGQQPLQHGLAHEGLRAGEQVVERRLIGDLHGHDFYRPFGAAVSGVGGGGAFKMV